MHSQEFTNTLLFYPREVALQRMPLGLPAGWELRLIWETSWPHKVRWIVTLHISIVSISVIGFQFLLGPSSFVAGAGIAEKKSLGTEYQEHVLKYSSMMRNPLFSLERAAEYLESWVNGTVAPNPLLDVSGLLARSVLPCVVALTLHDF